MQLTRVLPLATVFLAVCAAALELGSPPSPQSDGHGDASRSCTTATGGNTCRTQAARAADIIAVTDFNAKCDGTKDDAAAINAALSSGRKLVRLPDASCRAASTIVVPRSVTLQGTGFAPGNPPSGTQIVCDLTVTPCVATTAGTNNGQPALYGLTVARAAGKASPSTVGILVADAYNAILEDVFAYNHGVGVKLQANVSKGLGLGAMLTRVYTGAIADAHMIFDGWPEARISQSRFGMNGCGDLSSNTFVRYQGGMGGTAGGPNTILFQNVHFNQGCGTQVGHLAEFVNLGAPVPSVDAVEFNFDNIHVEGVSSAILFSDASWNVISRSKISNSTFSATVPFFALNRATTLDDFSIINSTVAGSAALSPSGNITGLRLIGNKFGGGLSLATAAGGSTVNIANNVFQGDLRLAGTYGSLTVSGNAWTAGGLVNHANGNWLVLDAVYGIQRPNHVDTRTVVLSGTLDRNGSATIAHGITNGWKRATINTAVITTPSPGAGAFVHSVNEAHTVVDGVNVRIVLGPSYVGRKVRITIQYTTSDDPKW